MSALIERFLAGERQALSRLLSHIERRTGLGTKAIQQTFSRTGNAHVVGITGPPGAGKSTLVNALVREYRSRGRSLAVLAIDPSSTLTGGATLGDRIRMMDNYDDPGVYIRSMATRGQMGGLTLAVGGAVHLLDAFGFDLILIETVGVGQDEVDIADTADTTVLIQVPGLGDSVQTIKAGVLEIADIFVVNKGDRPEARQLVHDLRDMLRLDERHGHTPPIVETTATNGSGIARLADEIDMHRSSLIESGRSVDSVRQRLSREVALLAREKFDAWITNRIGEMQNSEEFEPLVHREMDPMSVSERLVEEFRQSLRSQPD